MTERLKKAEVLWSSLFGAMADGVCMIDMKGRVLYLNGAAEQIFRVDAGSLGEGVRLWQFVPFSPENDALIQVLIDATMMKSGSHEDVVNYDEGDGDVRRLRVSMTYSDGVLFGLDGVMMIVITDLTELVRVTAAFARYNSKDIAEVVLGSPDGSALGGQCRAVTVLMSDLRGFTALSERLSPQELIRMLNHYFSAMNAAIEANCGTLVEFLGDGLFVVFGAPKADAQHATHAAICAIEMQKAMAAVNAWNVEQGFPEMEMGIGINTGEVIIGNIGSEERTKYGCMGRDVNLAGRIESFTVGGQILISETTLAALQAGEDSLHGDGALSLRGSQEIQAKGAAGTIMIFDLVGIGDHRLVLSDDTADLQALATPKPVCFRILEAKQVSEGVYDGCFTAMGSRCALLETTMPLAPGVNLMIDFGGDLYVKVRERRDAAWLIRYTSKPEGFEALRSDA